MSKFFTLDYETEAIAGRPAYPPKPVGAAVKYDRKCYYMAWGHPTRNNCTKQEAVRLIKGLLNEGRDVICHHGSFDLEVQEQHLGIPWPAWHKWHDTMFLAFLYEPHAKQLGLKPLSDKLLGLPPEEQDLLKEWILTNVPQAKRKPSTWGAYIARAPGSVVASYAKGDVIRTWKLFQLFIKEIGSNKQLSKAYDRERQLAPILVEMEQGGIPCRGRQLQQIIPKWEATVGELETKIRRKLKIKKNIELKFAGKNFATALETAGKIDAWVLTDKGNPSTSAENLAISCNDKQLISLLETRSQLATCINTFAKPWLEQWQEHGTIYATFNQVRQSNERGTGLVGARTGRLSMTPNLQNVIRSDKAALIPRMRDYIGPPRNKWFCRRDYTQQELRILAHYEADKFLLMYHNDPTIDAHDAATTLIYGLTNVQLPRRTTKDVAFAILYGVGLAKLAAKIGCSMDDAKRFKKAYLQAVPGLKPLLDDLKDRAKRNEPIYTWGGRRYFCEKPTYKKGRWWTYEYKMINYLIQGSAADCTKQAMINYHATKHYQDAPMVLQIHDELLVQCDKILIDRTQRQLGDAMADVDFQVAMLSDGKVGYHSWDQMHEYKE